MNNITRTQAIGVIAGREDKDQAVGVPNIDSYYGEDVFSVDVMKEYLPKDVAQHLIATIEDGDPINPAIAADVAHAMKQWAIARGATHFTHWFQPLTGSTAEKHDSFLEPQGMQAIMRFSGKNLITSEPDASSFPSGGLRCTFEARGYTVWDPTSPAFIKRHPNGATLCIPTAYCAYTGEALDKKTPLLRSRQALKKAVTRLMKCFGLDEQKVTITLGAEQEYFLIDKSFFLNRPDIIQTGRTLFGASPAKHQQLEDHYFGSIKPRVLAFMTDVEKALWKLGIPAKTRHNEVAPAQFELAPLFEEVNLAVDHNMLVMEVLRQQANKHDFVCLLHEKPFSGVNGSGKHNNWSINYGNMNLLEPGSDPFQNAIFMTVLVSIMEAVDTHADLLRSTVTGAGNDHRLGANEAPPAIISIFLGDMLTAVIDELEANGSGCSCRKETMKLGVDVLPPLPKDTTDRNRTSPFAFTGNKFEFRAPGSSHSCAGPMMILNTIVADAMNGLSDKIEQFSSDVDFNDQLHELLRERIITHKRVIFNGDNYSAEWKEEAEHRGLPILSNTPSALAEFKSAKNIALLEKYGVLSAKEVESRYEVFMEEYSRKIRIEAEISLELARTVFLPAIRKEYNQALTALTHTPSDAAWVGSLKSNVGTLGACLQNLIEESNKLESDLDENNDMYQVFLQMQSVRECVDKAEKWVTDSEWPLPKYREMLFIY